MRALLLLTTRELKRFYRQRSRLIGTLATPLIFWGALGGGISAAGGGGGRFTDSYLQFFFPGMVLLSTFFAAIFNAMSLISDRNEGFLQGVWCAPVSRTTILLSKCLGAAVVATIQGFFLLMLAPVAGIEINLLSVLASLVLLFWAAASISTLSIFFAWLLNSTEGFHSIMNIVILPMWFLSGGVFPIPEEKNIFYWIIKINPMSYAVNAIQEILFEHHYTQLISSMGVLAVFAVIMSVLTLKIMQSRPAVR